MNDPTFTSESTWEKLVAYRQEGFPMGCSTDFSGEGIVGNHAYSLLDVREIFGVTAGVQLSLKECFGLHEPSGHASAKPVVAGTGAGDKGIAGTGTRQASALSAEQECLLEMESTGRLRLILIRNPWGKVEWKGTFSSHSSLWTSKLRKLLSSTDQPGMESSGTFWMTYHDFLRRFSTIDVCKAYRNSAWRAITVSDTLGISARGGISTDSQFTISVRSNRVGETAHVYLSLLQDSKRGGTPQWSSGTLSPSYWYSDLTCILRRSGSAFSGSSGDVETALFSAPMRNSIPAELHLTDGDYTLEVYRFIPLTDTSRLQHYYVHLYTPDDIVVTKETSLESAEYGGTGRSADSKRIKLHHRTVPRPLHAELSLTSFLFSLCGITDNNTMANVAIHRLCSHHLARVLGVDMYVMCGNGINILFMTGSRQAPATRASHGVEANTVIDLTGDDVSTMSTTTVDSWNSPRSSVASLRRTEICPLVSDFGAESQRHTAVAITCDMECDVRVISPFKTNPSLAPGIAKLLPPHCHMEVLWPTVSCNFMRVLAVFIDNQYSDGFELNRKNYIRNVHTATARISDEMTKIESYVCDDRNIMYPNYFRCFKVNQ